MKIRDSGMPDEDTWAGFFDPQRTFQQLALTATICNVVEFGCGYGTFTIPAAQIVTGVVYTLEIEPQMIDHTKAHVDAMGLTNVQFIERDFVTDGSGLADGIADYVMLFNINAFSQFSDSRVAGSAIYFFNKRTLVDFPN